MAIEHTYYVRLQEAYTQAGKEGWRTFYSRIIGELRIDNEPLRELLIRLGDNRNIFPEYQREIYYESIALLIAALEPIRKISPQDVADMGEALTSSLGDPIHLEKMEKLARGIQIFEQAECKPLYADLKDFIRKIVGSESNTYHAIMCVMYMIMALAHPELDASTAADDQSPVMTPAIAALLQKQPGIRW